MKSYISALVFCLFIGQNSLAADYYVDCDHTGSSVGTEANPFQALQQAFNAVSAGQVIEVMNGVCQGPRPGGIGEIARLTTAGSPGAPIVIRNYPGHSPQVGAWPARTDEQYGIMIIAPSRHVRIEGLTFRGMVSSCLWIENLGSTGDIEIIGNDFDGCGKGQITNTDAGGKTAVFIGRYVDGTLFERNVFRNTGRVWTAECDAEGHANCHQYRHDHAIYAKGKGHVIRNNLFYNNAHGYGIKMDGHGFGVLPAGEFSHTIVNNTFGPNTSRQPWDGYQGQPITLFINPENPDKPRFYIANNVFVQPNNSGSNPPDKSVVSMNSGFPSGSYTTPLSGNFCVNNIVIESTAITDKVCNEGIGSYSSWITTSNNLLNADFADLDFADPGNYNYRIGANSAAIGHGLASIAPQVDFDGNIRDLLSGSVDAGAFESGTGSYIAQPEPPVMMTSGN
ncbi:MAG: hypothetical protein HKN35_00515 [Woeseia sp.]|nr:hypothetical protein [Woeseia sp.]NNE59360.1 hypothetical protein [Woeseia sp.]